MVIGSQLAVDSYKDGLRFTVHGARLKTVYGSQLAVDSYKDGLRFTVLSSRLMVIGSQLAVDSSQLKEQGSRLWIYFGLCQ